MAASLAAAIAKVEGREFDLIVGYLKRPPLRTQPDAEMEAAFAGFPYKRCVGGVISSLVRRSGRDRADVEDATQDLWVELLEKEDDRLRSHPERLMGWLYKAGYRQLIRNRARAARTESLERLSEVGGDALLDTARPCVPGSPWADDVLKRVPPPAAGEPWSEEQIIGAFQRFRDFKGRPPKLDECRPMHELPSPAAIYRCFGTFADAVLAAGMVPPNLGRRTRPWRPLEAAEACRSFRWRNGRWPSRVDAERRPGELPSQAAMIRFFGGDREAEVQLGAEAILAG